MQMSQRDLQSGLKSIDDRLREEGIWRSQIAVTLESILLATDFSPSAETAKIYAQALAKRYQSRVRLMHVVDLTAAFRTSDAGVSSTSFAGLEKNRWTA